jgi:hypothetical protein
MVSTTAGVDPFFLMQHQETTTRLADLFRGGNNYTYIYIIPDHQILFKKIKSPKIQGPSLYFYARKCSSTLSVKKWTNFSFYPFPLCFNFYANLCTIFQIIKLFSYENVKG